MSETQLVKTILQAVNYYGFFWRNNTGAYVQKKYDKSNITFNNDKNEYNKAGYPASNSKRFVRYGLPGSADIIGVHKGRFVAIEVKSQRGRQSDTQRQFQKHIEDQGGIYILAFSVDDALRGLKNES